MYRRNVLTLAGAGISAAALAACSAFTTTTTNGVTTVTVNVADIDNWGTALLNGAALLLVLPGVVGTPQGTAISAVLAVIKANLAAFDASAGGSVTLSFNSTSVPAAIQSILTDGQTLLTDAQGVLPALTSTAQTNANLYITAIQTIVSVFAATIGQMTAGAAPGAMSQTRALQVLGVK